MIESFHRDRGRGRVGDGVALVGLCRGQRKVAITERPCRVISPVKSEYIVRSGRRALLTRMSITKLQRASGAVNDISRYPEYRAGMRRDETAGAYAITKNATSRVKPVAARSE